MVWLVAALHGATVLTKAQPRRTGCSTKKQRLRLKPRPSRENCLAETQLSRTKPDSSGTNYALAEAVAASESCPAIVRKFVTKGDSITGRSNNNQQYFRALRKVLGITRPTKTTYIRRRFHLLLKQQSREKARLYSA